MFDDEFLDTLPQDPYEAARVMVNLVILTDMGIASSEKIKHYDEYVEAFAALEAFIQANGLPFSLPEIKGSKEPVLGRIMAFFNGMGEKLEERKRNEKLLQARDKFQKRFGAIFVYQFTDGDLKRIQTLINELRELITKSELFDAKHKERTLTKLEGLQKELHKKMSSLDKLWGLIGDAGIALGKFGKDAKPFVERIREIAMIAWRTQARAEELPSATPLPLLSNKPSETDEAV